MNYKKKLQELTIKDNFMFGAVMLEEQNCRAFLEMSLGFSIEHVEVSKEKSCVYHPEYKGVRLDVFAKDEKNTHYNVEMQVVKKADLPRRSRYYHSHIDMELLLTGLEYGKLPDAYVIFICDFDPFGKGKYCYTFQNACLEEGALMLNEGTYTIFLSTKGKNDSEVSDKLVKFLKFVSADLENSKNDFEDDFVKQLQNSIQNIKSSREMEERFMILREMLRDERNEGRIEAKQEAVLDILEELGSIPDMVRNKIEQENNLEILNQYLKKAIRAKSMEQFQKEIL